MSEEKTNLEKADKKGIIDRLLERVTSRKLLVWATATTGLFLNVVPADQWVALCLAYIGSQAVIDAVVAYRNSGS
jgi:hypothetical protein